MRGDRTDENQTEIVEALRKVGCSVAVTSGQGKGFPDLCVGYVNRQGARKTILMEIKDGNKPPSAQKLTRDQERFHDSWRGSILVVNSVTQAIEAVTI